MRLIDADLLLEKRFENGMIDGNELLVPYNDVVNAIRQAPTVAAVEVVRCKDCARWDKDNIIKQAYSSENDTPADFAECLRWSDWSTCRMTRYNYYCSCCERRTPNAKDNV